MRDEASLRRLAEIGIHAYRPRRAPAAAVGPDHVRDAGAIVLLAAAAGPAARLVADVTRAIGFARAGCVHLEAADEAVLAAADGLVVLGDAQARAAGRALPALRLSAIGWVAGAEPARLAGDTPAKRALWSELKRMLRGLAASGARALR